MKLLPYLLLLSFAAAGAEVTEVPDAADGDDVFDATLDVRVEGEWHSALIQRQNTQVPVGENIARTIDVRELAFSQYILRLTPRIQVGVFHDLAVFVEWPVVLLDQRSTTFAAGTNAGNSTIVADQSPHAQRKINGWDQSAGSGGSSLGRDTFGFPARSYNDWAFSGDGSYASSRAGFEHPIVGFRWSPINNERDHTKPTITLQADYNLGIVPFVAESPSNDPANEADPGPVARAAHQFHLQIGMSKRNGLLDPYFIADAWLPFAASYAEPGYQPRLKGGFTFGLEIVPYESAKNQQKLAIDFAYIAQYVSEGRDYSELSDALFEITRTDAYLHSGVRAGLRFQLLEYVSLHLLATGIYDTEHILTGESIGRDLDGNKLVDLDNADERNEFFNPIYDTPGRQFSVADSFHLSGEAMFKLMF